MQCRRFKTVFLTIVLLTIFPPWLIIVYMRGTNDGKSKQHQICHALENMEQSDRHDTVSREGVGKQYLIAWQEVPTYIRWRPKAFARGFDICQYSNCKLTEEPGCLSKSDAVIFKGRHLPKEFPYRPLGQIWIFAEDETPYHYDVFGAAYKESKWSSAFNWTMTYDHSNTDIFLPYGEIRKRETKDYRNFLNIAKNKTKDAVIVTSNCNPPSKRQFYINGLKAFIDVDVLGECGEKWNCGEKWIHNDCFKTLTMPYRFYLAFENSFCRNYVTEKFFENFNYDIVIVSRSARIENYGTFYLPEEAYISTADFNSVEELGLYLQSISNNYTKYAELLHSKSKYYSPGFEETYQKALCDLCKRMNNQRMYTKRIQNIENWKNFQQPCIEPHDLLKGIEFEFSSFYLLNFVIVMCFVFSLFVVFLHALANKPVTLP